MEATELQNTSKYPVEKLNTLPKTVSSTTDLYPSTWEFNQCSKLAKEHPAAWILPLEKEENYPTHIHNTKKPPKTNKPNPVSSLTYSSGEKKIPIYTVNLGIKN